MRSFINSIVADVNWASVDSGKEEMYIELEDQDWGDADDILIQFVDEVILEKENVLETKEYDEYMYYVYGWANSIVKSNSVSIEYLLGDEKDEKVVGYCERFLADLENNGYFESVKNEKNQTIYKKAKQDKTEEVIPESMKRRYHEFYISFERIINKLFLLFEWKYGNGQDIENVSIEEKTSAVMEQLEDMGSGDSCLGFSELCEVIEKYMEAFRNGTSWTVVRKRENYGQRLYI